MKKIIFLLIILITFNLNSLRITNDSAIKVSLNFIESFYNQYLMNYLKNEDIKEFKSKTYYNDEKIIEIIYIFDNKKNLIKKKYWDTIVVEPVFYSLEYDQKNNIIYKKIEYKGTINYGEDFYIENVNTEEFYENIYNEKGKLIKIKYKKYKYGKDNYDNDIEYKYNENNKLSEIIEYSFDGEPDKTKIFNDNELIIKKIDKGLGKEWYETTYIYDQNNNFIEYYTEFFNFNKKTGDGKRCKYIYDKNNNIIEEQRFFNNKLEWTIKYIYDENNYLISENEYKKDKNLYGTIDYKYIKDQKNKIIKVEQIFIDIISYKKKYNLLHEFEYIYR